MFELKTLTREAIPAALEKAVRYRLLNEPEQAESICEDVLRIDPDNQERSQRSVRCITLEPVSPATTARNVAKLRPSPRRPRSFRCWIVAAPICETTVRADDDGGVHFGDCVLQYCQSASGAGRRPAA